MLPGVCIALGFWVAAVRIGDRSAWLLLVLLLSLTAFGGGGTAEGCSAARTYFSRCSPGFTVFRGQIAGASAHALRHRVSGTPAARPPLALVEMDRRRLPRGRRRSSRRLASGCGCITWTLARQLTDRPIQSPDRRRRDFGGARQLRRTRGHVPASLGWKAMTAPSPDARRRLRLLFVGAISGVRGTPHFSSRPAGVHRFRRGPSCR